MLTKPIAVAFKLGLVVIFVAVFTGCKPPGPKALLDGKRLVEKGRPEAAVARFEVATQLLPTNAHAWNYLAIAYHQSGQSSNALVAYQHALRLNPDLVETRLNLGSLWLEQGQPTAAKSEFTAYNLRRPTAPEGFCKIAMAELQLRETAAAEQHVRKSLQLDEKNPEAWNVLGLIQLQQRKPREAAGCFGAALQQNPGYGPALINLAVVAHQQLGDHAGALKFYRKYLELEPRPADADSVQAVADQLEKELSPVPVASAPVSRPQPARDPVREAKPAVASPEPGTTTQTTLPPPVQKRPLPESSKPVAPPAKRAPEVVRSSVQPEVKVTPVLDVASRPAAGASKVTEPASRPEPANALLAGSRPPAPVAKPAQPIVRKRGVTPLPPPRNTVFVESSPVAAESRESESAKTKLKDARRASAERYAVKGNKAMQAKRYVEAADAYRAAANADPDWFQAHFNLAAACIQAGRTTEAISACEQALRLEPDSAEVRYNLALALKQARRYSEAGSQLERVVVADARNVRAHLTLGNLYADQLRQVDQARLHYLKVLELDPGHSQAGAIHFWLKEYPAR